MINEKQSELIISVLKSVQVDASKATINASPTNLATADTSNVTNALSMVYFFICLGHTWDFDMRDRVRDCSATTLQKTVPKLRTY